MDRRQDKAAVVAKALLKVGGPAGAALAIAAGVPAYLPLSAAAIAEGVFNVIEASLPNRPDLQGIVDRIRAERTRRTVELLREALVAWAGLKPEYKDELDYLADVVSDPNGIMDDARFAEALGRFLKIIKQSYNLLGVIDARGARIEQKVDLLIDQHAEDREYRHEPGKAEAVEFSGIDAPSPTQERLLRVQLESLSAERRALLDQEGKRRWDSLNAALKEHSWRTAFELARELESWLDDQGAAISSELRGQILLSLANVAVIEDSGDVYEPGADTARAWKYYEKAENAYGTTPSPEEAERLLRVRAKLLFLDGKTGQALDCLEGLDSPRAVSLRLGVLIELGRCKEASDLVLGCEPDAKWSDDAIAAHIRAGQSNEAERVLAWAESEVADANARHACLLVYARERYNAIVARKRPVESPGLTQGEREEMSVLRERVQPLVASATSSRQVSTGLEEEGLCIALLLDRALGNRQTCQAAAAALLTCTPVNLEVARAVLRGDVGCPDDLPERLRKEHQNSFDSHFLAAAIETQIQGRHQEALRSLFAISDLAPTTDKQEQLCQGIIIAAQYCNDAELGDAKTFVQQRVGDAHRLVHMLTAVKYLRAEQWEEANEALQRAEDESDPSWLQLAGGLAIIRENWPEAINLVRKEAAITRHPEAFRKLAFAQHKSENIKGAIEAWEGADCLDPGHENTVHNLAVGYGSLGRFRDAANCYGNLQRAKPDDVNLAMNRARCLALAGNLPEAVTALDGICAEPDAPAEPLLLRAHLMHVQGMPGSALASLRGQKARFWSHYGFLLAILQLGYAANEESEANEALCRLVELRKQGEVPSEVFREATLQEAIEFFKAHRKRREEIHKAYLSGNLPWLLVGKWTAPGNHVYLAWCIRTQEVDVPDDPDSLAEYCLYSTNGFYLGEFEGLKWLLPIKAPPAGSQVVVDISALITAHRLDLLKKLTEHYQTVLVPDSYSACWLEERSKVHDRQPSQTGAWTDILKAVDAGEIVVHASDSDSLPSPLPRLAEYEKEAKEGTVIFRIRQVAEVLKRAGQVTDSQYQMLLTISRNPALVDDNAAESLAGSGWLLADASTLTVLHHLGVLNPFVRALKLNMLEDEVRRLRWQLAGARFAHEAGEWYEDLIGRVQGSKAFEVVPAPREEDRKACSPDILYAIDAARIAIEDKNRFLLADDRSCQQGVLNTSWERPRAFGTDALINTLTEAGRLTPEEQADCWLKLIRWRYRFLVPPVEVLRTLAWRFRDNPPGRELREVAAYVHDCMRDLGLFGGPEPSDPPVPMALELFNRWLDVLAHFCMSLWQDNKFLEKQAAFFTRWAVQDCLPMAPKALGAVGLLNVAGAIPRLLIGCVVPYCLHPCDEGKAHKGMNRIRRSLGLSREEFADAFSESVNLVVADPVASFSRDQYRILLLHLIRIGFAETGSISVRLLPALEKFGLVDPDAPKQALDAEVLRAIADQDSARRLPSPPGPFVFVASDSAGGATAQFLPDMLFASERQVRETGMRFLASGRESYLTPSTVALVRENRSAILAESSSQWVPAALVVHKSVVADFLLNLAGFDQCQEKSFNRECNDSWQRLVRPSVSSLLSVSEDSWVFVSQRSSAESAMRGLREGAGSLQELLEKYEQMAGHLALSEPLDLGTQMGLFLSDRDVSEQPWGILEAWLRDSARPWRKYHACQALVRCPEFVPSERAAELWENVAEVVSLVTAAEIDSDKSHVWRLHAALAAYFLRYLELHSCAMHVNRLLSISWWAATRVTNALTSRVPETNLPAQVREWLQIPILRGASITHIAWDWLRPEAHSSARLATLFCHSPFSIAMLLQLGCNLHRWNGSKIPGEERKCIMRGFCAGLLTIVWETEISDAATHTWAWDSSLLTAASAFQDALPEEDREHSTTQQLSLVQHFSAPGAFEEVLEKLPSAKGVDAFFLASRISRAAYSRKEAAQIILERLRDEEWRRACCANLPLAAWDVLAGALLYLQAKEGLTWQVEMPFLWLDAAEQSASDEQRAQFFLRVLLVSSVSGMTAGAVKRLLGSQHLPKLRKAVAEVRDNLRQVHVAAGPAVASRLRDICTLLSGL